ncbi:Major facilitator superfamily protein [Euphorbia peplus]|nr:Major facilitator superfamily protein [Euphorbia peplus]
MEMAKDEEKASHDLERKKGGLRTMPFIIANETLEKVAAVGLLSNMIKYLINEYNMTSSDAATLLFLWAAISYFLPVFGAFISDSYLGRFRVIVIGTFSTLLGLSLLWLTSIIETARPPHCDHKKEGSCQSPNTAQLLFLISAFAFMSIGAGGIRPCSLAFGADQFNNPKIPGNEKILQTYFNWYYASVGVSVMISVLFIVAIIEKAGWVVGFGIGVGFMLMSTVLFLLGSSRYVRVKANESLFVSFARVISAAWKNKHLSLPENDSGSWYFQSGTKLVIPTDKFRCLNKACIIRNREKDLDNNGLAIDPWNLCTVKQVEELKSLIKVLPIWSTGIMMAITMNQHSFPVLQAGTMDRHFIGNIEIPAASYGMFTVMSLLIWVAMYDRILVPIFAKFTKRPRGLTNKQRMAFGLVLSCVATAVAGAVEHKRRAMAIQQGSTLVKMSAMWLVPQYCLIGFAESLNAIGQVEFYYSQFPKTMSSIGASLFSLGNGFGNLFGSFIVKVLEKATKKDGTNWVASDLSKGHYDYYYWVLSGLSVLNVFYFLVCSKAYGSENSKIWENEVVLEEVEEKDKDLDIPLKH